MLALPVASLALAGCGGGSEQPRLSPDEAAGQGVFLQARCGACHTVGPFRGVAGPNLGEREPDFRTVVEAVRNGRGGMPSHGGSLTELEIRRVASYVGRLTREPG